MRVVHTALPPQRASPPQHPGGSPDVRPDNRGCGVCGAHRAGALLTALTGHLRGFPQMVSLHALSAQPAASEPHLQLSRHSTGGQGVKLRADREMHQRSPRNSNTRQRVCTRVHGRRSQPPARPSYPEVPPLLHPQIYSQQLKKQPRTAITNGARGAWSSCWAALPQSPLHGVHLGDAQR